jgi:1-aminocyclopropane-1-carboxylate deaminase/D-cysteine desulfhydrase-like pyridoxal-dependent ACC family enzyme
VFFERFPTLSRSLPHVALGSFPTPLESLDGLLAAFDPCRSLAALHLKNDGCSSAVYGGNKVRKLELVLGEALRRGAKEVLTFGFAGSNHATATAVHAASVGLRSISMLLPQANAPYVATNLLVSEGGGAELHAYNSVPELSAGVVSQMTRHRLRSGRWPFVIAPGGSSPLGTVGFVAAAFELAAQLEQLGVAPPDFVYVALGSGGTVAGLSLGFAAAGLPTRVVAIRVTELKHASARKLASLWNDTASLLHALDPSFPSSRFDERRVSIRDEFFGSGYAVPSNGTEEALRLAAEHAGLHLDVAYTGKALACLIADARRGALADKRVVFWNTYNATDLSALRARGDGSRLPEPLRCYLLPNAGECG